MRFPLTRLAAAIAVMFALSGAATAQPAPSAPAPIRRVGATAADSAGCNTVERPVSAAGASLVPDAAGQQKNWQPPGGEISFTVRSFTQMPADALVLVCFRWKRNFDRQDPFITARPVHLDLTDAGRLLKVTVIVPSNLPKPPSRFGGDGDYTGLFLVPLADVRILILGKNSDGSPQVAADVSHEVGISSPLWATLITGACVLGAFALLTLICHRRLRPLGLDDLDPFTRIITSPDGYASLSPLQMVIWTFVVAASAVYVMVLSGELIEVTTGTLVLLGISGAVTVGSKLHDSAQVAKAVAVVHAADTPAPLRRPRWSDLVVNDTGG